MNTDQMEAVVLDCIINIYYRNMQYFNVINNILIEYEYLVMIYNYLVNI